MFTSNRNIDDLTTAMAFRVKKFLKMCKKEGLDVLITEGKRTKTRQRWLYSFGRFGLNMAGDKVTWTLESKHIIGEAIDIVPLLHGEAWWTASKDVWGKLYRVAGKCGLKSLYLESGYDRPHLNFDHLWNSQLQKTIDNTEKILAQDMDKAWKVLENPNARVKHLAELKGVKFRPYIIIQKP